jgi:starch phosphorylase
LVHAWAEFASHPDAADRVIFLEDYDIELAREMVQGVDVWINTPRVGREACGTSGMKVLVNGGLNLSVRDGWWDEAYGEDVGWAITADRDEDAAIAAELFRLLEQEVIPDFYLRDEAGVPPNWIRRIRASMAKLAPLYSSNRMLQHYIEQIYRNSATHYQRRLAAGGQLAKTLQDWQEITHRYWRELRWGQKRVLYEGEGYTIEVDIYLDSLGPDRVQLQLFADTVDGYPRQCLAMELHRTIAGAIDSFVFSASVTDSRPPEHFTPRVLAYHQDALVPQENSLILWWQASE